MSSNGMSTNAAARSSAVVEAVFDASPTTASAQPQASWGFSVMCYNILADTYAQHFAPKLYRDVPRSCLDWSARRALLLAEIRHWAPDVVCLQEVQHYQDLEPEMRAAGYEGRFMRRTGRRRDGCATFWRADRLRACSIQRLDFAPLALDDNVAMLLSLAPRCEGAGPGGEDIDGSNASRLSDVRLLVATTHITFDPAKGDVKLGQLRTLLHRVAALAAQPPPEEPPLQQPPAAAAAAAGPHAHLQQPGHQHYHHSYQHQHQHPHHSAHHHQHPPQQHAHHRHLQHHQQLNQQQQQPADAACSVATAEGRRQRKTAVLPALASVSSSAAAARQLQPGVSWAPADAGAAPGSAAPRPLQTLAIITGDFNSTAGSPLYQYVARGSLDLSLTSRKKLSGQLHGVCHTQYRPVAEVKQLHAQLTAATAATGVAVDPPAATAAAGSVPGLVVPANPTAAAAAAAATITTSSNSCSSAAAAPAGPPGDSPFSTHGVAAAATAAAAAPVGTAAAATVVAAGASPPSTPPSTPCRPPPRAPRPAPPLAEAEAQPDRSNAAAKVPLAVAQRLAAAAESVSAAAASAVVAAAAAAAHPLQAPPTTKAAGASKVLDTFLTSIQRSSAERWTEKELRCAMGDQYGGGSLGLRYSRNSTPCTSVAKWQQRGGGGSGYVPNGPAMSSSPSCHQFGAPTCRSGGGGGGGGTERRLGRHHVVPTVNSYSADGTAAAAGANEGPAPGRRSLELEPATAWTTATMDVDVAAAAASDSSSELVVWHPLRLRSSYVEVASAEPAFTSIHSGFMGTVDFIWYTADPILPQTQLQGALAPGAPPAPRNGARPELTPLSAAGSTQHPGARQPGSEPGNAAAAACAAGDGDGANVAPDANGAQDCRQNSAHRGLVTLVPVAVLQPPDLEGLPRGLPAPGWGSDHISVMTQFELRLG